jgi:hypothetical protein
MGRGPVVVVDELEGSTFDADQISQRESKPRELAVR